MFKRLLVSVLLFVGVGLHGSDSDEGWEVVNPVAGDVESGAGQHTDSKDAAKELASRAGTGGSSSPEILRYQVAGSSVGAIAGDGSGSPVSRDEVGVQVGDMRSEGSAAIGDGAASFCPCLTRSCKIAREMCTSLGIYLRGVRREKESVE